MPLKRKTLLVLLLLLPVTGPLLGAAGNDSKSRPAAVDSTGAPALWRNPSDIAARDLYYGPGGKAHQPHGTLTFVKEDRDGTNPKFVVRDEDDVKWKVKMGSEARPETAATRIAWAAGYFADEDYLLGRTRIDELPQHLHRGQKYVHADSSLSDVRLKREEHKKTAIWRWKDNPFTGTREFNGLRVVMALINNWDVKDVNNAVYEDGDGGEVYMVSDLGASFGTPGASWPLDKAKGNLKAYSRSRFIAKMTPEYVDFKEPARPSFIWLFRPDDFFRRMEMRWIGRHIPRTDARWMGDLLAQLSPAQIRDAFRAAGYTPDQANAFAQILEGRIEALRLL